MSKKKLYSAYIDPEVWAKLNEVARYRTLFHGEVNGNGQPIGAGTVLNELLCKYIGVYDDELEKYHRAMAIIHTGGWHRP
jgi:hypothetical protein